MDPEDPDSGPGAVFTKGLSKVLGLSWLYFYTKVKPKTWLRPFVNTAPDHSQNRTISSFYHFFLLPFVTYPKNIIKIHPKTRLGQLGANISPDRSSLTPQVLIGNF